MKYLIAILLFTCVWRESHAQVNYVLNPSLEQYSHCPTGVEQISRANYWVQIDTVDKIPFSAAEYCNACATGSSEVSVPTSGYYHHYPRTGNGMAHVQMYFNEAYMPEPIKRDYMTGQLYEVLTVGRSYCVTFYVTLTQLSGYAINHIGAYLDDGHIDTATYPSCASSQTEYIPQVVERFCRI